MDNDKAEFVCKLSSVILFLGLLCVVFFFAKRWNAPPSQRLSSTGAEVSRPPNPRSGPNPANSDAAEPRRSAASREPAASQNQRPPPVHPAAPPQRANTPPPIVIQEPADDTLTVRLADGRELTFGGLTFGFEHNYVHSQATGKARSDPLPQKADPSLRTISLKTTAPSLVVWLHCRASRGSLLEADFISIVDETGREGELSNPSSIFNPAQFETIGAWQVSNFPRRDGKIGVRFYSRDGAFRFHRLAEFWAANPAPRKYEVWPPERAPIVKKVGDVEFRFVNLNNEPPPNTFQAGPAPPAEWTTSVFKVYSQGKLAPGWRIESVALSDATGNEFVPESTSFNRIGDYLMFSFNRTFWGSESSGKLRAEFLRTSGFSSNELVTFKAVRVPTAHDQLRIGAQAKLNHATLTLEHLKRQMPPVRMAEGSWNMELTATLLPEAPGTHASLVALVDQTGKSFPTGISHKRDNGRQSFLFDLPAQSELVNVTFAVQKGHFVEFIPALNNEAIETRRKSAPSADQSKQASLLQR